LKRFWNRQDELERRLSNRPAPPPRVGPVTLTARYISAAVECEIDKQGRILVPNALRDYAALHKDVLWAGMVNLVELWSREKWNETQKMTPEELVEFRRDVSERLRI